jgi:hypothetical protein
MWIMESRQEEMWITESAKEECSKVRRAGGNTENRRHTGEFFKRG